MDDLWQTACAQEAFIGCLPILCLKENNGESSFLNAVYKHVPKADYYIHHQETKPALGTYQVHKSAGLPTILNCYVKTYPQGETVLKSDNLEKRRAYFEKILQDVRKMYPNNPFYFAADDIKGLEDILRFHNGVVYHPLAEDRAYGSPPFTAQDILKVVLYPTDFVIYA